MTYKLLTFIVLIFSLPIKDEYTYQPLIESPSGHLSPLPEGNSGIAARYPGDVGIGGDSAVVFADDFESYGNEADLTKRWNEAYHAPNIRIAKEPGNIFHGAQALEFTGPKTNNEMSNTVVKLVSPERDSFFLRYYAKFDPSFNVLGSSHNGCVVSASYWTGEGSGPGIPADGYNKFLASYEAWRGDSGTANPGRLNVYVYHPNQRSIWGDHLFPSGNVLPSGDKPFDFGPEFVARPDIIPELGRWYCFELMVKSNTPGQRNGRIAMWLDGNLVGDFPNLRLRDTTALKIDRFSIDLHIRNNTMSVTKKWVDNVVAATSYIGPMR